MPRFSSIASQPDARSRRRSRYMARARTVADVLELVLGVDLRTAAVSSSVTVGAPQALWLITLRPSHPSGGRGGTRQSPGRLRHAEVRPEWRRTRHLSEALYPDIPSAWLGMRTKIVAEMRAFPKDIDGRGIGLLKCWIAVIGSRRPLQDGRNVQGRGEGRVSRPWGRSDRGRTDQGDLRE